MSHDHEYCSCFATRTLPPDDVFYLQRMNQQQPLIIRKPRMSVNYNYVPQLILDHDINYSDEIDEEETDEEEEDNNNELVDHDMFGYLEPPTYYYARAMHIDDGEEQAYCFICCLELQNEDILIVTLPYGDAFHVDCVNDQLRRRNAEVLPTHEEIVEEEEEDEFEDEEILEEEEEEEEEEKFEVEISTYNALAMDIDDEEEQETCAICLLEYKDEDIVGTLQCGHEFHAGCVQKWLLQKNACPFCRAPV
uniref:RING-type E3 ubiquitin transferase n=1 Tax=Nicotiana tabacum TaxID=4097 RepID=A0A1S3Z5B6_TOBAC|nr:PREDICTED: protein Ycf2-like [Nicotiana tabacum]